VAARKNKILHDDKTKRLIRASQLLNRLNSYANGEIELTQGQVQAARIVIGKEIGDIAVQKVSVEGPVQLEIVHRIS
jgi:hypothetical protein